jgi:tetratricopeptide (TPR) repeat protein
MSVNAKQQLPEIFTGQAQVEFAKGNVPVALELAEKAVNFARELKLGSGEVQALRLLGQVLLANGQRGQAMVTFEKSFSNLADKDPYEVARTKNVLGTCLISTGDKEQGIGLLQDARTTFERLGALRDLESVERYLRERN